MMKIQKKIHLLRNCISRVNSQNTAVFGIYGLQDSRNNILMQKSMFCKRSFSTSPIDNLSLHSENFFVMKKNECELIMNKEIIKQYGDHNCIVLKEDMIENKLEDQRVNAQQYISNYLDFITPDTSAIKI